MESRKKTVLAEIQNFWKVRSLEDGICSHTAVARTRVLNNNRSQPMPKWFKVLLCYTESLNVFLYFSVSLTH